MRRSEAFKKALAKSRTRDNVSTNMVTFGVEHTVTVFPKRVRGWANENQPKVGDPIINILGGGGVYLHLSELVKFKKGFDAAVAFAKLVAKEGPPLQEDCDRLNDGRGNA